MSRRYRLLIVLMLALGGVGMVLVAAPPLLAYGYGVAIGILVTGALVVQMDGSR